MKKKPKKNYVWIVEQFEEATKQWRAIGEARCTKAEAAYAAMIFWGQYAPTRVRKYEAVGKWATKQLARFCVRLTTAAKQEPTS